MTENIYQSLKVEFVELLSENEIKKAYDFWTDELDYLIDNGNNKQVENASMLCEVLASHLA